MIKYGICLVPGSWLLWGCRGHDDAWRRALRNHFWCSSTFLDLNRDGTPDVIIGGRSAELQALDGKTVRYPGVVAGQLLPRQTHFARRELSGLPVRTIRWGAYMGERGDGRQRRIRTAQASFCCPARRLWAANSQTYCMFALPTSTMTWRLNPDK